MASCMLTVTAFLIGHFCWVLAFANSSGTLCSIWTHLLSQIITMTMLFYHPTTSAHTVEAHSTSNRCSLNSWFTHASLLSSVSLSTSSFALLSHCITSCCVYSMLSSSTLSPLPSFVPSGPPGWPALYPSITNSCWVIPEWRQSPANWPTQKAEILQCAATGEVAMQPWWLLPLPAARAEPLSGRTPTWTKTFFPVDIQLPPASCPPLGLKVCLPCQLWSTIPCAWSVRTSTQKMEMCPSGWQWIQGRNKCCGNYCKWVSVSSK